MLTSISQARMSLLASLWRLGSTPSKPHPCCPCDSHDSLTIVEKAELLQDELADAKSQKARSLVQSIVSTHAELLKLKDLRPGKTINRLLGDLVTLCSDIYDQDIVNQVLNNPTLQSLLPSLRQICAEAEACLEHHWTDYILRGCTPEEVQSRLKSFPYYHNYEDLTRLELCAILSATKRPPSRIAFIGSGPLPLTSLCLLDALKHDPLVSQPLSGTKPSSGPIVLNIDCSPAAISSSLSLSLALGPPGQGMEFICADVTDPVQEKDLVEFDVVYMAALVGMSQAEKEMIILQVADRMRPGALLVVRSAWGMRTCLYPEVQIATEGLLKRLEICVVVHPYGQVVNSVVVARVRVRE